jgi:hypothetical protein
VLLDADTLIMHACCLLTGAKVVPRPRSARPMSLTVRLDVEQSSVTAARLLVTELLSECLDDMFSKLPTLLPHFELQLPAVESVPAHARRHRGAKSVTKPSVRGK